MIDLLLLEELSKCSGVSGYEENVGNLIKKHVSTVADRVVQDGLGSVIGIKNSNGPKVMVAAHMDEVGFIVKSIDKQGFLKLTPIGSWWSHMLLGQTFTVITSNNHHVQGVVGSRATHGIPQKEKEKTVSIDDIYLDLGVNSIEECQELGIKIGDMVTPYCEFRVMNNPKFLCGKAFDDRIGVYIGIEVFKRLQVNSSASYIFAATAQEEPGLRGARTATDLMHPRCAFAIDTTLSGDTPMDQNCTKLGGGVVLSMIDSNTLAHRGLVKYITNKCKEKGIKHQYAVFNKGGTDSGNIHKSFEGIVNMTLSIPVRYMHTNQSIIHLDDVESCIELLVEVLSTMDDEVLHEIESYY